MLLVPFRHAAGTFKTSCGYPPNLLRVPLKTQRGSKWTSKLGRKLQSARMSAFLQFFLPNFGVENVKELTFSTPPGGLCGYSSDPLQVPLLRPRSFLAHSAFFIYIYADMQKKSIKMKNLQQAKQIMQGIWVAREINVLHALNLITSLEGIFRIGKAKLRECQFLSH